MGSLLSAVGIFGMGIIVIIVFGVLLMVVKMYHKVDQGQALVRNGVGGSRVSFSGMLVIPVIHQSEIMDISLKRVEIERAGKDGLICQDNVRADIKVVFFVRVNKTVEEVLKVAQSIGCVRASDHKTLVELFDAKFSEALKTIGKQFDFVELYNSRDRFREDIVNIIGTELNGYILDDAAIDYLEQTTLESLNPNNILDAEGIKKITDITARERILANQIERNKEKTITQQDVEAKEAILELNRQLAESEERQKREIASITAREEAEAAKIQQEERWKSEQARIRTDEEVAVAEQNKDRQVIAATKNKERTEAIETERVEKDRALEQTERERIVTLAEIEKERAIEEEKKNIQEVIRERVMVEKAVVEEEEKIKDTKAFAEAERIKKVAITHASQNAEEEKLKEVIKAEAAKDAAEFQAEQKVIEAEAEQTAAERQATAMKTLADAKAKEEAVLGMSEVQVMEARANAVEKQGTAEANVMEKKALAEAKGIEAKAAAVEKQGAAEANVMAKKFEAEAQGIEQKAVAEARGIEQKAEAMKKLDGVGREHEEFKLKLQKEKDVELAQINIAKDIADAQARIINEGLKSANIDIVGGDSMFFDKIVNSVSNGKSIDRLVEHSRVLSDVKATFFSDDGREFADKLRDFVDQFGLTSDDLKNLTLSALIAQLMAKADDEQSKGLLSKIKDFVTEKGLGGHSATVLNDL